MIKFSHMTLAERILALTTERGFTREQAEVIILMREAAVILFRSFPDSFLLYGGADLILFHQGPRHSADLDLLSLGEQIPALDDMRRILSKELEPLSRLLKITNINIEIIASDSAFKKLRITTGEGTTLFTIDVSNVGAILASGIDADVLESASSNVATKVRFAARDLLLLQKAEAFLLRKPLKIRDAFDIKTLMERGATLANGFRDHLDDQMRWQEIEKEEIEGRIHQVDRRHCDAELKNIISQQIFDDLQNKDFRPLRDTLSQLFLDWL